VLKDEPDWTTLPPNTPHQFDGYCNDAR